MDAVLIAVAGVLLASAQFQVETTLQSVAVQVTDKQGNSIPDLQVSDFTLLEDGRPQKVAFFAAGHEPISMAILLDMGRTMDFGGRMERAQALLAPLLRRAHTDDEVFVMPFTDEIGALGHRGSAIYDALAAALCRMRSAKNVRQAVVVITGGLDQDSRLNLDQLLQLVGSSQPQVFMVGLFDKPTYRIYSLGHEKVALTGLSKVDNPLIAFRQFAVESGAEAFFPSTESK